MNGTTTRTYATCIALSLLLATPVLLGGCRTKEVVTCKANQGYDPKLGLCYDCPPGTKANHGTASCVPVGEVVDVVSPEDVPVLDDVRSVPDEVAVDVNGPDGGDDVPGDIFEPKADVVAPGEVGAKCNMDAQCLDGYSCFDWPGGYCVQLDCAVDEDCPSGSACLPLLFNGQACFDTCATDADCRTGYGCKSIATLQGDSRPVCHPLSDAHKPLGAACQGHEQCDGSLSCVPMGPQSVCTQSACSAFDPCPDGASCIPWGLMTICLPGCKDTPECLELSGSPAFSCQEMEDVLEVDAMVCSPAQQGLAVGSLCFFSTECSSGYCLLMISGICSGPDGSECGADADCNQGLCVGNPAVQKGVCSGPCGPGELCPEGSLCGTTSKGPLCLSGCTNYGESCGPEGFGMSCTYGTLFYPPAPSGKYACAKPLGGEAGTLCKDSGDCVSGICYGEETGSGICATTCFTNNDCSFGTQCLTGALVEGQTYCTRICFHDLDCPDGFSCKNTFSQEKACLLP
jgi:hypothetical protein